MKKNILKVMIIMGMFFSLNVKAEAYYTTPEGIELSKFQYETITNIFSEEKAKNLTQTEYDNLSVQNMIEGEFEYNSIDVVLPESPDGLIAPYSTFHETSYKRLSISKNCYTDYCEISTYLVWKSKPAVKSYDVIGARLLRTSFYSEYNWVIIDQDGTSTAKTADTKWSSAGIGTVFQLPSSGNIEAVTQKIRVKNVPKAIVYSSYQHAVKVISLSKAINFTFSGTGYGSVFVWTLSYGQIYDQMGGVSITL